MTKIQKEIVKILADLNKNKISENINMVSKHDKKRYLKGVNFIIDNESEMLDLQLMLCKQEAKDNMKWMMLLKKLLQ